MKKIRVLIVDDHVIVREGLRALMEVEPDIEVVGEATDGDEAVTKTGGLHPDIVLMDITMPRLNGLEATKQIKQLYPEAKIMVLTMHESNEYFFKILEAGASGYFIKGGSSSELIAALHTVREGEAFIYPSMTTKLLSDYLHRVNTGSDKESYDGLTKREREGLKLVAEGHTKQEIAEILVMSTGTDPTHRAHLMAKLGLRSRTELIKYAIRRGFITLNT